MICAAALAATVASSVVLRILPPNRTPLMLGVALLCAYAAYELVLYAATPFLGGAGAFTVAIVTRLGALSAVWLVALVSVCEIVRLIYTLRSGRAILP